ncbi:hypothetical protein NECAME_13020 [Necator americanus]|uniref:Uncharacterized protein n=1 Tax=Necator americanus TaxID=51031 RepID=W2SXC0_NECAM|nr:hypothetical protein NECAME_13020 [Necator americanus]ETN74409.1 hypothetical protein NECAME_13020 [Necator americanus]
MFLHHNRLGPGGKCRCTEDSSAGIYIGLCVLAIVAVVAIFLLVVGKNPIPVAKLVDSGRVAIHSS